MKPSLEALQRFVGGQLEIQQVQHRYYRVGEIARVEENENDEFVFSLRWLAMKEADRWVLDRRSYRHIMNPLFFEAIPGEDGRLLCSSHHEQLSLWPTHFVKPTTVEGLETAN